MSDYPRKYLKVGRATDLTGSDRVLYRFLEILPGFLSWATLIGVVLLSWKAPVYASYFIIAFALYWLFKTMFLSIHLRHNWKRIRYNMSVDWTKRLERIEHDHIIHLVLLPFYKEPLSVVEESVKGLLAADGKKSNMIVVLAAEERAGEDALAISKAIEEKYAGQFRHFMVTVHPEDTPGEIAAKGANITHAAEQARINILDRHNISYENVVVSAFDIDTVVYPQYFQCLAWHFLTTENPYKVSFQPVPFFNNNIWDAPALSRVVATSSTFWEMIQQERPERMATFSSHSVSFKALYEIGYWQTNMVNEDSRIYWNLLVANDGDYGVVPLSYPVSMDANVGKSLFQTMKNVYKQHRRWTYGVENLSYMVFNFIKNKKIPLGKRIKTGLVQAEGYWALVTNPLMLFMLSWLPLFLGGRVFKETILSYNLPIVARNLLTLAMIGLIVSALISLQMLPKRPEGKGRHRYLLLTLQWLLVPITMTIFSAIPGLDAQTRLMFGKYMGFWVTPKDKKDGEA